MAKCNGSHVFIARQNLVYTTPVFYTGDVRGSVSFALNDGSSSALTADRIVRVVSVVATPPGSESALALQTVCAIAATVFGVECLIAEAASVSHWGNGARRPLPADGRLHSAVRGRMSGLRFWPPTVRRPSPARQAQDVRQETPAGSGRRVDDNSSRRCSARAPLPRD